MRQACIFTTHTPVPAGHDQFSYELVKQVLGDTTPLDVLQMLGGRVRLNMTLLALNMSSYVNGVAKRHGEVSQDIFPGYAIDSITNGVHSVTWTAPSASMTGISLAGGLIPSPCGMWMEKSTTPVTSQYHGEIDYFCAKVCKEQFDQNQESAPPVSMLS